MKGKYAIIVGIIIVVIGIASFLYITSEENEGENPKTTFDVDKAINDLNANLSEWNKYRTVEVNWVVFERKWTAMDAKFIQMYTWDEFTASLKQDWPPSFGPLSLDVEERVIWYGFVFIIYFYY